MRREDVSRWLERYVAAWKSGDRGEIEALFGDDARYRYFRPDGQVDRVYDNVVVLRLDAAGRCSDFREWYTKRP